MYSLRKLRSFLRKNKARGEHVVSEIVRVHGAWNTRNNEKLRWSVTNDMSHMRTTSYIGGLAQWNIFCVLWMCWQWKTKINITVETWLTWHEDCVKCYASGSHEGVSPRLRVRSLRGWLSLQSTPLFTTTHCAQRTHTHTHTHAHTHTM